MSTTFGIFKYAPKTDGHGEIKDLGEYIENEDYVVCAFRTNEFGKVKVSWIEPFGIIEQFLPDSIEVYSLDNTQQGLFTIGDIKNIIRRQNNGKT